MPPSTSAALASFFAFRYKLFCHGLMNDSVARGSTPLSSPCHRTPDNFFGGIRNVRCLVNNGGILSSQLQQYRSEMFRSRSHHYLTHTYASGEKYENQTEASRDSSPSRGHRAQRSE